ncbi:MAG: mycofactocin system FadH/OYE family oxidoreductase 2, partial [Dehalococcoidia bacterium]|nr:mycofactocin system FadH/OYE family oxidoreductase 2 [Dehalococcoidia bacterium]
MTSFKNLFTPLKVGSMTVKNRLVFLPHRPTFADPGEATIALIPGPRHVAYWVERAKGGVGWIGTQGEPVHVDPAQNAFVQPDSLARFRKLASAVHQYD